jgi:hypothetical protein
MSPGITTGVGGASLDWDRRRRVTPVQTTSQEAWPEAEPLGWNNSLRREPWWNAGKRARSVERAPHRKMRRLVTCVCRRSASFIYFVARVEQSETRERRWSRTFVPGFRCAQSRLRNDETGVSEDESQAPPLTFSKPSRVRQANRASLALRGTRRRMPFSQQCLVIRLERAGIRRRAR